MQFTSLCSSMAAVFNVAAKFSGERPWPGQYRLRNASRCRSNSRSRLAAFPLGRFIARAMFSTRRASGATRTDGHSPGHVASDERRAMPHQDHAAALGQGPD